MLCHCCGLPGHFQRHCPQAFDVRYMKQDERDEWLQHLLVAKDVEEVQERTEEVVEDFGPDNE